MNLNCKFKIVGAVDSDIRDSLLLYLLDAGLWGVDVSRQRSYDAHRKTQSVMFRNGDLQSPDFAKTFVTKAAWLANLESLRALFRALNVDENHVVNMIAVRLPAVSNIEPHNDGGPLLSNSHRIHVPLATNEKVDFIVGGERFHMSCGNIYEINNMLLHSVENHGSEDRIHLIFDYVN